MLETYRGGYVKALLDVQSFFENRSESIKSNRLFNYKGVMEILKFIIDNRDEMIETGTVEFVVCDKKDKTLRKAGHTK